MSNLEILFWLDVLFPSNYSFKGVNLGEEIAEAYLLIIYDPINGVIMPLGIVLTILLCMPLGIPLGIINFWPVIEELNFAF